MKWSFEVSRTRVKTALSKSRLPGLDYALNPYIGCSHGCIYCYARLYTSNREVSEKWGGIVVVKENIVDVLRREVTRYPRGLVGVGTITDAYQPVEAVYRLTRRSLEVLLRHGFKVSIQTKNPLVLRDLDLLTRYTELVDVGFTITSLDPETSIAIEPNAPPPGGRVEALKKLVENKVKAWIFYGPIIPGINSDYSTIKNIVELSGKLGVTLYYDSLHVKDFMKTPTHPLNKYIGRVYSEWRVIEEAIIRECRKHGVTCKTGFSPD